jgi:hypothetical protein
MKRKTIDEVRDELAEANVDSFDIYTNDLKEIFLYGIPGIVNYSKEELVDSWLNAANPTDLLEEDADEGIQVAEVVDSDGTVLFKIFQEDRTLSYEKA